MEVLIRNVGDHLHGTRSSTPSPPSLPPSSFRVSTLSRPLLSPSSYSLRFSFISFPFFVPSSINSLSIGFLFYSHHFSRYPDLLYFAFIFINLSLSLTFIDFNLSVFCSFRSAFLLLFHFRSFFVHPSSILCILFFFSFINLLKCFIF